MLYSETSLDRIRSYCSSNPNILNTLYFNVTHSVSSCLSPTFLLHSLLFLLQCFIFHVFLFHSPVTPSFSSPFLSLSAFELYDQPLCTPLCRPVSSGLRLWTQLRRRDGQMFTLRSAVTNCSLQCNTPSTGTRVTSSKNSQEELHSLEDF